MGLRRLERPCVVKQLVVQDAPVEPDYLQHVQASFAREASSPRDLRSSPRDPRSSPRDLRSSPRDPRSSPLDLRSSPLDPRSSPRDLRSSPRDPRSSPRDLRKSRLTSRKRCFAQTYIPWRPKGMWCAIRARPTSTSVVASSTNRNEVPQRPSRTTMSSRPAPSASAPGSGTKMGSPG